MPKIIVVMGKANSRKTTAIKQVMNSLGVHVGAGPKDVLVSAHLHVSGAGYSVGFASGGDLAEVVQRNITFFSPLNLSHMVFACRSKGEGIRLLNAYASRLGVQPIIVNAPSQTLMQDILQHIP